MSIKNDIVANYIRVGGKYFKDVQRPDKNGKKNRILIEWNRQTILDDFGEVALDKILKYNGFIRNPSHTDFKPEIEGFYNQYFKLSHIPKEGEFPTIMQILKHIFQDKIDFGLDYYKLLYEQPTIRLPVLVLESDEKGTGKTTLGDLNCWIFEENAIQLGNADFETDFSGHWLNKLSIIVDETTLNGKGIMQTIKRLTSTKNQVTSNEKNKGQVQIDYFGKMMFTSNSEGNALPIERGCDRFAVFKVPTLESQGIKIIPDVEKLVKGEIPAFLHFLLKREMVYQERGRFYFDLEVYKTDQLLLYYENNCSTIAMGIKDLIKDTFDRFPDKKYLQFSVINLLNELKGNVKNLERGKLKKVIEKELNLVIQARSRYTYFSRLMFERHPEYSPKTNGENNTCYIFSREDFIFEQNM